MVMTIAKEATCRLCHTKHVVIVPAAGYLKWAKGQAKIQDALPGLTDDERELLVSGICGQCFDKMFAE
jgi:hypothetical protein